MPGIWKHGPSLALLALVLMALSYVGIIVVGDFERRIESNRSEIRSGLNDFVVATDAYFETYEAVVGTVAETDCVRNRGLGGESCAELFSRLNRHFFRIVNFAAIDGRGRFFASGTPFPPSGPPDASAFPFFQEMAKGNRALYVMDPHRGPVTGEAVTGFVLPLYDQNHSFDGVIGVSLRFQELETIWRKAKPNGNVGLLVFDRHGEVIFTGGENQPAQRLSQDEQHHLFNRLQHDEGVVEIGSQSYIFRSSRVAGNDWLAVAILPGPYGIKTYLRDTAALPQLLLPTLVLAFLAFFLSYRDWRNIFALEEQVVTRTAELLQANAEMKRANRDLAHTVAELETFAWVASHDLREPLRTVSAYVSMIEKRYGGMLDEDGRTFIAYARDGAKRMNDLVLDLLDYVKVGRDDGPRSHVQTGNAIALVLGDLHNLVERAGAMVRIDPTLPAILFINEGDLTRLFLNLLENAIKFRHPEREPVIVISAHPEPEGLVFQVEDNGIGIEAEYYDKIFTLFQRLDPGNEGGGTGIGLTVCRKIVGRYGGRIWVESQTGTGSRFRFTLPDAIPPDTIPFA
ncbi:MAG: GHKL domain-containing protein [Magnetospirillum sp.]|nr:GHKL domain-containing protein [Magnetospirillum sp.]